MEDGLLFINGTLMRGLGLHENLSGAKFLRSARTEPRYRLYSIRDQHPGMFEVDKDGVAVEGELYEGRTLTAPGQPHGRVRPSGRETPRSTYSLP